MAAESSKNGYGPRDQQKSGRQPGAPSTSQISHPYPPNYRTSPPPSQSYAYDNARRNQQSFSDAPNPYNPRPPSISVTAAPSYGGQIKEGGTEIVVRGPKIGKKKYAENWTKEDEEAERLFLQKGMFDWKKMRNWKFWFRLSWWYWYIILVIVCVLVALMTIYNDQVSSLVAADHTLSPADFQIVAWLTPVANWMKALPAGYTIPVAVLFVLSFPPLFGQEIICLLVGAVWGLWVGFAIVTVGTMLGEIGNFYAFKYCLRGQAVKLEETNPNYACLAHIVREGGFFLAFVIRLSAVPGGICDLRDEYLGLFRRNDFDNAETVLTIWSAWYIWNKMNKARTIIWRRERLAEKAAAAEGLSVGGAQINRRVSYKAMLDQPNDDIEALSPMLPKDPYGNGGDMRQAYSTPYELQQVPLHIKNTTPTSIDFSLPPPSYRSESATSPSSHLGPSRRDSGTLPTPLEDRSRLSSKKRQADQARNTSSYDIDGPEVRENRIDFSYGYTPSASTEQFPTPQPLPQSAISPSKVNRLSTYDPSAEEGYDVGARDGRSYPDSRRRDDVESGAGRRSEGSGHERGGSRGYQLTDPGY